MQSNFLKKYSVVPFNTVDVLGRIKIAELCWKWKSLLKLGLMLV